jgi:hypothetical protein
MSGGPGASPPDLIARRNAFVPRWAALAKSDDPEIASLFCAGPVHWLKEHHLGDWKAPTSAMLDAMEQYVAKYERKGAAS